MDSDICPALGSAPAPWPRRSQLGEGEGLERNHCSPLGELRVIELPTETENVAWPWARQGVGKPLNTPPKHSLQPNRLPNRQRP